MEDFVDLQAEKQTLWILAGKQILFDFTKMSLAQNCNFISFHFISFKEGITLRQKPFFKGPSDKNIIVTKIPNKITLTNLITMKTIILKT